MGKVVINYQGCISDFNSLPISSNALGDFFTTVDTAFQYYWSNNSSCGSLADWKLINGVESNLMIPVVTNSPASSSSKEWHIFPVPHFFFILARYISFWFSLIKIKCRFNSFDTTRISTTSRNKREQFLTIKIMHHFKFESTAVIQYQRKY